MKKAFGTFDTDKSGSLSKEEFREVMLMTQEGEDSRALTDDEFDALYAEVDTDKNGSISFDEYYEWTTRRPVIVGWPRANARNKRKEAE